MKGIKTLTKVALFIGGLYMSYHAGVAAEQAVDRVAERDGWADDEDTVLTTKLVACTVSGGVIGLFMRALIKRIK